MKTKMIATLAVLMMVFAGVGIVATDDTEAATADKELVITYDGFVEITALEAMLKTVNVDYIAERNEVEPTVDNIDDYKAYVKPFAKNGVVTVPYEIVKFLSATKAQKTDLVTNTASYNAKVVEALNDYYDVKTSTVESKTVIDLTDSDNKYLASMTLDDMISMFVIFADVSVNTTGDIIGGLDTQITVANAVTTKTSVEVVNEDDVEEAIAVAVAIAIAAEEAKFADYSSPEEVAQAINEAVAIVKAEYKDWYSPEEVAKLIDEAKKEGQNGNIWMYAFAVVVVVLVALSGFTAFIRYGKKKAPKAPEEPQA